MQADGPGHLSCLSGQLDPPLGWASQAYGHKQPCTVLRWQGRAAQWQTWIEIEEDTA